MDKFEIFKEFCNDYLVALTDDKFALDFTNTTLDGLTYEMSLIIDTLGLNNIPDYLYRYSDIKDYFIPFIMMLNDSYPVLEITIFYNPIGVRLNLKTSRHSFEDIINDRIDPNEMANIFRIEIVAFTQKPLK